MKTLEDRLSHAGDELRRAAERVPPMQAPKPQPLRSAFAFVAGAAVVVLLVAVPVWLLGGGSDDDGALADTTMEGGGGTSVGVFMLPEFVPDGFSLSNAQLVDVEGRGTEERSVAAGTILQYMPEGSTGQPGEPSLSVEVSDLLATYRTVLERDGPECYDGEGEPSSEKCREYLADSSCVGEEAIADGRLDPEACIEEEKEAVIQAYGDGVEVDFEEVMIRGLPALITSVASPDPGYVSVTTYEGGPVVSIVAGHLVDDETLVRVATGLRPVSPEEFAVVLDSVGRDADAGQPQEIRVERAYSDGAHLALEGVTANTPNLHPVIGNKAGTGVVIVSTVIDSRPIIVGEHESLEFDVTPFELDGQGDEEWLVAFVHDRDENGLDPADDLVLAGGAPVEIPLEYSELPDSADDSAAVNPEAFFADCMAEAGFEVLEVQIGRNLERVQIPSEYRDDPEYSEVSQRCEVSLYEKYGIPVYPESDSDGSTTP